MVSYIYCYNQEFGGVNINGNDIDIVFNIIVDV